MKAHTTVLNREGWMIGDGGTGCIEGDSGLGGVEDWGGLG